ncbi:hypothetical protein FB45DRAFT_1064119 [Roridomyces roridus]|uniref:Uncharacterized protein n=1 Tax=Roridomyces roridus TaxID=1738132 RepID=A0AAD7BBS2_9AGAR|nr:hypothetical protein FB45DRAFT_1064119 [Roridomyces roridus]
MHHHHRALPAPPPPEPLHVVRRTRSMGGSMQDQFHAPPPPLPPLPPLPRNPSRRFTAPVPPRPERRRPLPPPPPTPTPTVPAPPPALRVRIPSPDPGLEPWALEPPPAYTPRSPARALPRIPDRVIGPRRLARSNSTASAPARTAPRYPWSSSTYPASPPPSLRTDIDTDSEFDTTDTETSDSHSLNPSLRTPTQTSFVNVDISPYHQEQPTLTLSMSLKRALSTKGRRKRFSNAPPVPPVPPAVIGVGGRNDDQRGPASAPADAPTTEIHIQEAHRPALRFSKSWRREKAAKRVVLGEEGEQSYAEILRKLRAL